MNEFKAVFEERIERTKTILSFRFRSDENIDFLPGQFVQIVFDEGDKSNRQLNKFLSFSSSPGIPNLESLIYRPSIL